MTSFVRIQAGIGYFGPPILGPDSNFWASDNTGNNICRITPAGVVTQFAVPSGAQPKAQICTDGTYLYMAASNGIVRVTTGGSVTYSGSITSWVNYAANGLLYGPDGNIWGMLGFYGLIKVNPSTWASTAYPVSSYSPGVGWSDGTYMYAPDQYYSSDCYKWTTSGTHTVIHTTGGGPGYGGVYISPYNWVATTAGGFYRIDASNAFVYYSYSTQGTSPAIPYDGTNMWINNPMATGGILSVLPATPTVYATYGTFGYSAQINAVVLGADNQPYGFDQYTTYGGTLWGPPPPPPVTMQFVMLL